MKAELVTLNEKLVVGLKARTNNTSPSMPKIIGGLWQKFYAGGVFEAIKNKSGFCAYGIYSEYAGGVEDDYSICVATEVTDASCLPSDCVSYTIPSGRYAKYVVQTTMQDQAMDVGKCWQSIWSEKIDRTFVADFEEYLAPNADGSEIVNIYVGLK